MLLCFAISYLQNVGRCFKTIAAVQIKVLVFTLLYFELGKNAFQISEVFGSKFLSVSLTSLPLFALENYTPNAYNSKKLE